MKLSNYTILAMMANIIAGVWKGGVGEAHAVCLFTNNITPTKNSVIGDFDEATFTGYTGIQAEEGNANFYIDPLTSELCVELVPPVGGFNFECTSAPASPEAIYGYYVVNFNTTQVLGAHKFENPISIAVANQAITLPKVEFRLPSTLAP